MKIEAIHKTIDSIKKNDKFCMDRYQDCGTPCCIVGHISSMQKDFNCNAGTFLGLTSEQEKLLFYPKSEETGFDYRALSNDPDFIDREHAIACLENLITNNVVDWKGTKNG